jgi:hypothetical protein
MGGAPCCSSASVLLRGGAPSAPARPASLQPRAPPASCSGGRRPGPLGAAGWGGAAAWGAAAGGPAGGRRGSLAQRGWVEWRGPGRRAARGGGEGERASAAGGGAAPLAREEFRHELLAHFQVGLEVPAHEGAIVPLPRQQLVPWGGPGGASPECIGNACARGQSVCWGGGGGAGQRKGGEGGGQGRGQGGRGVASGGTFMAARARLTPLHPRRKVGLAPALIAPVPAQQVPAPGAGAARRGVGAGAAGPRGRARAAAQAPCLEGPPPIPLSFQQCSCSPPNPHQISHPTPAPPPVRVLPYVHVCVDAGAVVQLGRHAGAVVLLGLIDCLGGGVRGRHRQV